MNRLVGFTCLNIFVMKRKNFLYAVALLPFLCTGCSDSGNDDTTPSEGSADPEIFRTKFVCQPFAEAIDTDFGAFSTAYAEYILPEGRAEQAAESSDLVLGGYFKTPTDSILLRIAVAPNAAGKVESITATAEDAAFDRPLWEYCLSNYESLGLGSFLGSKYTAATEGGVLQTIDEALQYVAANGMDDLHMCTLFSAVAGKVYAVPTIYGGGVQIQLVKNYLELDYPALRALLGTGYDDFAEQHYILGNKMSLWGDNYIYIDYALDSAANIFSAEICTDAELQSITSINLDLPYAKYDTAAQIEIWKSYVKGDANFGLGTFKEAYKSDGFGGKGASFESRDALIAQVEQNGRPGAFDGNYVVEFEDNGIVTTLTLKSLYTQIVIKKAA